MNRSYILFALGIGAALGGGIALLYTPQSGAQTRKKLGQTLDDAAGQASNYAEDVGDYLKEQAGKLSAEAQKTFQQANEKATDVAQVAADVVQKSAAQTKAAAASMF